MESSNHIFTPLKVGLKLTKNDCLATKIKCLLMEAVPYSQVVGSLMHVIIYIQDSTTLTSQLGVLPNF